MGGGTGSQEDGAVGEERRARQADGVSSIMITPNDLAVRLGSR